MSPLCNRIKCLYIREIPVIDTARGWIRGGEILPQSSGGGSFFPMGMTVGKRSVLIMIYIKQYNDR